MYIGNGLRYDQNYYCTVLFLSSVTTCATGKFLVILDVYVWVGYR